MVINTGYGGFSLTNKIVERLEERGCLWTARLGRAPEEDRWYPPAHDELLRQDPDLVAVVRALEEELQSRSAETEWEETKRLEHELTGGLRVIDVHVEIEVVEDDAGRESVRVYGGAR